MMWREYFLYHTHIDGKLIYLAFRWKSKTIDHYDWFCGPGSHLLLYCYYTKIRSEIAFGLVLYRVPCQCRALAWPFIVINRKLCLSASRRHTCKVILFDRSSLSAEVKIILVSLVFSAVVVARKRLFCFLCGDVLKSRLVSYCIASLALAWPFIVINRKLCSAELE